VSVSLAVNILWVVWYTTWIGAVIWSGKTRTQLRTDIAGPNRYLAGFGSLLLFLPTASHGAGHGPWRLLTGRLWRSESVIDWAFFALTVAAFAFCWWARLHLGRLWSGFVTLKEDHRVVDTGPYGLVRHPIYAGAIFAALMTALIRATPMALIGFVLFALGFWMTARIEERFLREELGAGVYDDYSRRVGMLLPKLA
jgi:protein-S-isoprenylcysteine O-methyltransferase Ste14